jgi:polyketide cyclase/dehydrase/lipid transport protein
MHFEVDLLVRATRDKVYSAYIDFDALPKWSKQAKGVVVSKREGNTIYLEGGAGGDGQRNAGKMELFPPEKVESEGETRFTRTKSAVRFEEAPGGTKVIASLDVQFKGRWGWFMKTPGRAESESSAMEELTSFASYVESIP